MLQLMPPALPQPSLASSCRFAGLATLIAIVAIALAPRLAADAASRAYLDAVNRGDHNAAYRAQSFLVEPYGDDPNIWHGIEIRKAVNGRVGKPSHPFTYQDMTHLKVRALYDRAGIAQMEKVSRTELQLIQRICNWANSHWGHMRPIPYATWDGLEILDRAEQGDGFWCEYKAALFVQACTSAGLSARIVGINRKDQDSHMVAEVYSNEFRTWMLVDPWWNCYYERAGVPISAIEFHRAAANLAGIELVFGENGKKNEYWDWKTGKAAGLPHANKRVPVERDELKGLNDWYHDIHIVLRNDHTVNPQQRQNGYVDGFMVPPNFRGGDWRGAQLHWVDERTMPQLTAPNSDDISDFEWPLNEVKVDLRKTSIPGEPAVLEARFTTFTPGFAHYRLEVDGKHVPFTGNSHVWRLNPGANTLRIAAINAVGRSGFPSEFVLTYDPSLVDYSRRVAVELKNPGWEDAISGKSGGEPQPAHWSTITSNALKAGEFVLDANEKRTGRHALRATPARDPKTGLEYAFIVRSDNFAVNAATDVIYSVWLKSSQEDTPVDLALLEGTYKGHGTYVERISVGRAWKRYELKCRLHSQLTTLFVGFKVYRGTVWADDASIVEAAGSGPGIRTTSVP